MSHNHMIIVKAMKSVYVFGIDNDLEMTFDDFKQPGIIIQTLRNSFIPQKIQYDMCHTYIEQEWKIVMMLIVKNGGHLGNDGIAKRSIDELF